MTKYTRLAFASLAAMLVMAAAVGTASANRLRVSNTNIRVVWNELLFGSAISETTAVCPLTLEGTFHSATIDKVEEALIGYVTRVRLGTCQRNHATILTETLPWHLTYDGYAEELPDIEAVFLLLIGAALQIEGGLFTRCLFRTTTEEPFGAIAELGAGGRVEGLSAEEATQIRTRSGGGTGCPVSELSYSGTATVTLLGNSNAISITLI